MLRRNKNKQTASVDHPKQSSWAQGHEGHHPELHKMCVIDTATNERIIPNGAPVPIENDLLVGHVMLLIRTPDVDSPSTTKPSLPKALQVSQYMRGRQRRWEFQFQFRLKKIPTGPLFLACEGEAPVKIGRVTKGLTGFLLAMIGRINSGFHYSWGITKHTTEHDLETGNYEKIHLAFPVEASMDRIVQTKPGDAPPELGQELPETEASVKRRRKMGAGSVDWNTADTYSMCLWSAYMDWIQWRVMNVPGIRPFPLSTITGTQAIYLAVYEIKDITPEEYRQLKPPHLRKNLNVYSRLEMSHVHKTQGAKSDDLLSQTEHYLVPDEEVLPSALIVDDVEEKHLLEQLEETTSTASTDESNDVCLPVVCGTE